MEESDSIEVDVSLTGERITETLDRVALFHGLPKALRMDNGPEFQSKALNEWVYRNGVQLE
jgi:putative transposase